MQIEGYLRFDTMDDSETDQPSAVEVINKTVNFCKLLTTKSIAPVIRLSMNEFAKYGVLFKQCPIKKVKISLQWIRLLIFILWQGHYYLSNFKMDEELLPPYLPETGFLAMMRVFANRTGEDINIWDIKLNGRIDKSKGFDNLRLFTQG